jgi:1,4-dihydroxy-2-naphthoyl-CoA hydrolase
MKGRKLSPAEYAAQIQEWARGTALGAHGVRFISAGEGRARAELEFRPELAPLTGMFHIGAIMTFAEETASAAGMWQFNPTNALKPDLIPLTFQLNFNQVRNASRGKLMADAEIVHRGRTLLVVEVKVHDDDGKLIATMSVTQMAPRQQQG